MNSQTLLLAVVSSAALAAGVAYCPAPHTFVQTPDSAFHVTGWRDSGADCRIVTHPDYGMFASCWPRRFVLEPGR